MLQIPEGLQMGSIYAAGEHAIPAGIEFIFEPFVLPICHPYGAHDVYPMLSTHSLSQGYKCPTGLLPCIQYGSINPSPVCWAAPLSRGRGVNLIPFSGTVFDNPPAPARLYRVALLNNDNIFQNSLLPCIICCTTV